METSASFEARYAPLPYPTNHVDYFRVARHSGRISPAGLGAREPRKLAVGIRSIHHDKETKRLNAFDEILTASA